MTRMSGIALAVALAAAFVARSSPANACWHTGQCVGVSSGTTLSGNTKGSPPGQLGFKSQSSQGKMPGSTVARGARNLKTPGKGETRWEETNFYTVGGSGSGSFSSGTSSKNPSPPVRRWWFSRLRR